MTQYSSHIDETQLMLFLLGEASAEQTQQITKWLLESEENQKELDLLEAIWAESSKLTPNPVAVDVKGAWGSMSLRVDNFEEQQINKIGKVRTLNQKIARISFRAAAILVVAIGIFKFIIDPVLPVEQMAFSASSEVFKGTLPDGSKVALNLNTKLSYPKRFKQGTRKVKLEGEAFFDVAHNHKKPFIISAGDANIRVWGTSFNVKANKGDDVEVSVSTGKVQLFKVDSVSGDTASIFLTAGQKGILPSRTSKPEKLDEQVEPDEMFWMDSTLVFQQIELNKVISTLEKYYNVNITIENRMALTCSYTATFSNADIEDILEMMATTFNFQLLSENNSFVLKGNGCLDD
ncbi:MAG: FecR domain-containing protein [Salinivirgaceae bacterium]|jgi:transmembrane sensor|nr:FecR domain-containing protein [Salinivirgaceae bacterium]